MHLIKPIATLECAPYKIFFIIFKYVRPNSHFLAYGLRLFDSLSIRLFPHLSFVFRCICVCPQSICNGNIHVLRTLRRVRATDVCGSMWWHMCHKAVVSHSNRNHRRVWIWL